MERKHKRLTRQQAKKEAEKLTRELNVTRDFFAKLYADLSSSLYEALYLEISENLYHTIETEVSEKVMKELREILEEVETTANNNNQKETKYKN